MDNNLYKRRNSLRLEDYDYSHEGAYFITICIQDKLNLFGTIDKESQLVHNNAGKAIEEIWTRIPSKFEGLSIDHYVIMPNHIHGILVIENSSDASLSEIVQWFKTMTTNVYINGVKNQQWETFKGKLWQRSYHDHIIRKEASMNKLREYILTNPSKWAEDIYFSD